MLRCCIRVVTLRSRNYESTVFCVINVRLLEFEINECKWVLFEVVTKLAPKVTIKHKLIWRSRNDWVSCADADLWDI